MGIVEGVVSALGPKDGGLVVSGTIVEAHKQLGRLRLDDR
jgi:hypothetical protein